MKTFIPRPPRSPRLAAARTIATEQATPLMQLDLIVARLEAWQHHNRAHRGHAAVALVELQRLRASVASADNPPLAVIGPGGAFTNEILADDGRLGGAY